VPDVGESQSQHETLQGTSNLAGPYVKRVGRICAKYGFLAVSMVLFTASWGAPGSLGASEPPNAQAVPAFPRVGAIELLDNDRGRVWDVFYPPGMPTAMHRHESDFVGVELVDSLLKLTTPDGKIEVVPARRGEMYLLPKGSTHIEEGVIGHPQRNAIIIELKNTEAPAHPMGTGVPNGSPHGLPNGFAAIGAQMVVDAAQVRIWNASWPHGAKAKAFFQSRDLFLVPIGVGILSITSAAEPARLLPVADGQVVFLRAGQVRSIQSMHGTLRAAVVEVK